jgi:PAS domain S-box-containing protein
MDHKLPSIFSYFPSKLKKKSDQEDLFQEDTLEQKKQELEVTNLKLLQMVHDKTKQLERVTHYLDSILKNINEGLIFVSQTGMITTYNAAAEKILGMKQKDVLFTTFSEKFADSAFGFSMSEALKSLTCPGLNFTKYIFKGKYEKEIEVSTSPVFRKGKSQQGIILVLRDITMQRLQMKKERQNQRMQELGQMAATVAHEIRNPLGGIEGFASLLQSDLKECHPEMSTMAGYIIEGTKTIGALIENVLGSARPLSPQLQEVNMVELIDEMKKHVEVDPFFSSDVKIVFQTYETVALLLADRTMIRSCLMNLLRNAHQAIDGRGTIHLTLFFKEENLIFTIKDSGRGIAPEHIDHIFSPFFTTKDAGTGLGLYETYRMIQSHNGHIEVKSSSEWGTLFIITLPMKGFLP